MKKIVLTLLVTLVMFAASAQIKQGTVLVGASSAFGVNSDSPKSGSSTTNVNLDLKGGYFLIDNLVVGLNAGYLRSSNSSSSFSITTVGLFGRYYVQGKVFVGAGFNSVSSSPGNSSTSIPFEVGYAAFITSNIAIEPSVNFVTSDNNNSFGVNVGLTLYLNRK